jgi:hypothetical protein
MSEDQPYRYVYGLTGTGPLDVSVEGVGGDPVTTVEHGPHAAIVSDVDTLEPEESEKNVRAHDEVLRTVMTHGEGRTVVPMQFGMVFKNDRVLENVFRGGRRAIAEALNHTEGTVELGVKVVTPTPGDGNHGNGVKQDIANTLADVSIEESPGDQFSDRLLLNRSYLVERENRDAFDDAIDDVRAKYDELLVQYTGPWPPYNFVAIEIGAEA